MKCLRQGVCWNISVLWVLPSTNTAVFVSLSGTGWVMVWGIWEVGFRVSPDCWLPLKMCPFVWHPYHTLSPHYKCGAGLCENWWLHSCVVRMTFKTFLHVVSLLCSL